jgi:hypothetical protein
MRESIVYVCMYNSNIIYNSIYVRITPNVNNLSPNQNLEPNILQTYTPQPSTPIKHAGSVLDIWVMGLEYWEGTEHNNKQDYLHLNLKHKHLTKS